MRIRTRDAMIKLLTGLLCCLICVSPAQAEAQVLELAPIGQEAPTQAVKPEQEASGGAQAVEIVQSEPVVQEVPAPKRDAVPETPPAQVPQVLAPAQQAASQQAGAEESQSPPVLRFYDEKGQLLHTQPVPQGSVTIAPEEKPVKDGYLFFFWYEQSEEEIIPFVFGSRLARDVALKPHYIAIQDVLETGEFVFSLDEEVSKLLPETNQQEAERCVMTSEQADDLISEILEAVIDQETGESAAEASVDTPPAPDREAIATEIASLTEAPVELAAQEDGEDALTVPDQEEIAAQILTLAEEVVISLPQADAELSDEAPADEAPTNEAPVDEAQNETDSMLNEDGVHVFIAELVAGMSGAEAAEAGASNALSGVEISIGLAQYPDGTPFAKGSEIAEGQRVYLVASISNPENHAFTMQWQRDTGSGWTSIPGETSLAYGYEVTAENVHWNYRLQLIAQH